MMNKVKILSIVCVVALVGLIATTLTVRAQTEPSGVRAATRLAVCDVVHVFNNYQKAIDLTRRLESKSKQIQAENQKRKEQIKKKRELLKGLKGAEYERHYNEMRRMELEREAWLNYQDEMARREHHRLTGEMYEEVLDSIEQIAAENGFDIVLQKRGSITRSKSSPELLTQIERRQILYANDATDITQMALERINSSYKKSR